MSQEDPTCRICGERKSAHVATVKGAFTHPREARGEGLYVLAAAGTLGMGPGADDVPFERWEFRPNPPPIEAHPTELAEAVSG